MAIEVSVKKQLGDLNLNVNINSNLKRIGILGASGCGKSITLKMLAGIEKPDEGRIVVDERLLFYSNQKVNLKPQDRCVGYLFQNYALFPMMTVGQNIGAAIKMSKAEKEATINSIASIFQLEDILKLYPRDISGGQQQRVALARMLASKPRVLLLDEPFSALDSFLKEEMHSQLKRILDTFEGSSVIVTHDREEAYEFSDYLLLMDKGKVIQAGLTKEVFANPSCELALRIVGDKYL